MRHPLGPFALAAAITVACLAIPIGDAQAGTCSFWESDTNSANSSYSTCTIYAEAGQTIDVGTCGVSGSSGSNDTYLRLARNGSQVASNDDSCGLLSRITYTAASTGDYELRMGCYSSGSCSGTASWEVTGEAAEESTPGWEPEAPTPAPYTPPSYPSYPSTPEPTSGTVLSSSSCSFWASYTSSATTSYDSCSVWLNQGETIDVGTCSATGGYAYGDTYLRLAQGGYVTTYDDDGCTGLTSRITHTASYGGYYEIRMGCYSDQSCSGSAGYNILDGGTPSTPSTPPPPIPASPSTPTVSSDLSGTCSFSASYTSSAQSNYSSCSVYVDAGETIEVGTCGVGGAYASGDTYLRLFQSGNQVASNDDYCALYSKLTYTATTSGELSIHMGCYSQQSCSGTVGWEIEEAPLPPHSYDSDFDHYWRPAEVCNQAALTSYRQCLSNAGLLNSDFTPALEWDDPTWDSTATADITDACFDANAGVRSCVTLVAESSGGLSDEGFSDDPYDIVPIDEDEEAALDAPYLAVLSQTNSWSPTGTDYYDLDPYYSNGIPSGFSTCSTSQCPLPSGGCTTNLALLANYRDALQTADLARTEAEYAVESLLARRTALRIAIGVTGDKVNDYNDELYYRQMFRGVWDIVEAVPFLGTGFTAVSVTFDLQRITENIVFDGPPVGEDLLLESGTESMWIYSAVDDATAGTKLDGSVGFKLDEFGEWVSEANTQLGVTVDALHDAGHVPSNSVVGRLRAFYFTKRWIPGLGGAMSIQDTDDEISLLMDRSPYQWDFNTQMEQMRILLAEIPVARAARLTAVQNIAELQSQYTEIATGPCVRF